MCPQRQNQTETAKKDGLIMVDVLTPEQRRKNMSNIRASNTRPELRVRRFLHGLGYRFRLNSKDLPGKPDIVLPRFHTVLFVHGCFWHRHDCKYGKPVPDTRQSFWLSKFQNTVKRDRRVTADLESMGWHVFVVWECETKDLNISLRILLDHLIHHESCSSR